MYNKENENGNIIRMSLSFNSVFGFKCYSVQKETRREGHHPIIPSTSQSTEGKQLPQCKEVQKHIQGS